MRILPDFGQKIGCRMPFLGILAQKPQQIEFDTGQFYFTVVDVDLVGVRQDSNRRNVSAKLVRGAAQVRTDARCQFAHGKGLANVIVAAIGAFATL
jgi:hypothetical protein